jgi:catechol 2,3-dioxygenase-like lactoylglutathione lyase family enzyme
MVRVTDIEASLRFYRDALGLELLSRRDNEAGRFTLVFLAAPATTAAQVELTYNWPAPDGRPRPTPAAATSATWPTRWTTSTPPAAGCRSTAC